MDLKEESLLCGRIDQHWYYRAKLAALLQTMDGLPACKMLDIGAGSGFFSRALLQTGRAAEAVCVDTAYPADRAELVAGRPLLFRRTFPAQEAEFGLVIMMDVLEHIQDDVGFTRDYVDQFRSGTRVIVTVPAFQWLWSGHDVFLEHYRRYTLPGLDAVLRAAGLRVEFGSYYYGTILPIAAALRLGRRLLGDRGQEAKSDMRQTGPLLNTLLLGLCRAELPLMRVNRLAGLSVFARAYKP